MAKIMDLMKRKTKVKKRNAEMPEIVVSIGRTHIPSRNKVEPVSFHSVRGEIATMLYGRRRHHNYTVRVTQRNASNPRECMSVLTPCIVRRAN